LTERPQNTDNAAPVVVVPH